MPKHDIILILFKCCVSQMYLIVLLSNLNRVYNNIDCIDK